LRLLKGRRLQDGLLTTAVFLDSISTFCISLWLVGILRLTSSYRYLGFKRRQQQERFSCKASATYVSHPEVPPALPDLHLKAESAQGLFQLLPHRDTGLCHKHL